MMQMNEKTKEGNVKGKEGRPSKPKRVAALVCVFLLLGLYLVTLVSAIFSTPATAGLFRASLAMTIFLPLLLYGYQLICRVFR